MLPVIYYIFVNQFLQGPSTEPSDVKDSVEPDMKPPKAGMFFISIKIIFF